VISRELTRTSVLVIPTNEELVIARAARELVFGSARSAA
jgi:acetate kinase